jgi:hypothetical protein
MSLPSDLRPPAPTCGRLHLNFRDNFCIRVLASKGADVILMRRDVRHTSWTLPIFLIAFLIALTLRPPDGS